MGCTSLPDPAGPAAVYHRGRQVTPPEPDSSCLPLAFHGLEKLDIMSVSSSRSEMEKWMEDIQMAIDLAEKSSGPTSELLASSPPDNSTWCGCTHDLAGGLLSVLFGNHVEVVQGS